MKTGSLIALLLLIPCVVHGSEFTGPIGAGAEGLRFSTGASPARVSIAVAKTTACGSPWYAYENADGDLGRLWTATLTEARAQGASVRIVGNGACDSFGVEGVSIVEQHVGSNRGCARTGAAPMTSLDAGTIALSQTPGQKRIAYQLAVKHEVLLILVEDAPGLQPNQIRLEVDLDPEGAGRDKAIEAWSFCQGSRVGSIQAAMDGGFGVGVICDSISSANNFRSGCTVHESMIISQDTTSEIWLRQRDWAGIWHYAEGIDSTIWKAFGGRSVRFIWKTD
jgi:hypothetical protein